MKKYRQNKAAYAAYLILLVVVLSAMYYALSNYALAWIFKYSVGWPEAVVLGIVLTVFYEFILPRVHGKKKS